MIAWCVLASVMLVGWAAIRRLVVVRVVGHSMVPAFDDGARLLAWRPSRPASRLRVGRIVVFRSANGSDIAQLVKRVAAVSGDPVPDDLRQDGTDGAVPKGHIMVRGDNPHSLDSRRLGFVSVTAVTAVVLWCLDQADGEAP